MKIEHCERCNEDWCYRGNGRAIRCGKCKSPYWDRPYSDRSVGRIPVGGEHGGSATVSEVRERVGKDADGEVVVPGVSKAVGIAQGLEPLVVSAKAGASAGSSPAPRVSLCRSCESPLTEVKGKLVCMDDSCGLCGQEQKGKRC